jgi:hypothetical protein
MMRIVARMMSLAVVAGALILFSSCGGKDAETPAEKIQLDKLSKTWNIESAQLDGNPRTDDFSNFKLTITGPFNSSNPTGPYNFSVSGSRPDKSPWDASGTWTFTNIGTGDSGSLLRNDGVPMNYTISGNGKLTISNLICSACDYDGARTKAVNGNWTFVFN